MHAEKPTSSWNCLLTRKRKRIKRRAPNCSMNFLQVFHKQSELKVSNSYPSGEINPAIFDKNKVIEELEELNICKSTGPDGIGNKFLKQAAKPLNNSHHTLYQTTIYKGSFTEQWKVGQIIPAHNGGSKIDVTCYRPISRCCVFNKSYPFAQAKFHPSEFGFR